MSKDKKLISYATRSKLMDINISYGDEEFAFNLNAELVIDENRINHEAQVQPSSYAFLSMLHKKLIRQSKIAEKKMEKKYSELFIKFKGEKDEGTGRQLANETARAKILRHPAYEVLQDEFIEVEHQAMVIEVCVRSFEQRANLIQTLSANLRKEK
jgi:hypothetical protein